MGEWEKRLLVWVGTRQGSTFAGVGKAPSLPIGRTLLANRLLGVLVDREEEIKNGVSMQL
jgi:hypothetical protein